MIKHNNRKVYPDQMKNFMQAWSLDQAEANHVETIEEANDFNIGEEDEDFFPPKLTVYEMHENAEDNLKLLEQEALLNPDPAESNETGDQGESTQTTLTQSAPVELNSPGTEPPPQNLNPLSENENSDNTGSSPHRTIINQW